jgi:hypothetical protein
MSLCDWKRKGKNYKKESHCDKILEQLIFFEPCDLFMSVISSLEAS